MKIKLHIPITLTEIAEYAHINAKIIKDEKIEYITTDSRECETGDLFIAIPGENVDGADFAQDAIAKGAYVICNKEIEGALYCPDTKSALLNLSCGYKNRLPKLIKTVAVTGSVGKSSTKEFLAKIIEKKYIVHATNGNHNNEIGLPLTILSAAADTEILILEMGMNHKGEIEKLSKAAEPDIAIINNIGTAHIGNLGSRENIAKAKLEIISGLKEDGKLLVPANEPLLMGYGGITVSCDYETADAFLFPVKLGVTDSVSDLFYNKMTIYGIKFGLPGKHMLSNLAFAIVAGIELGLSEQDILSGASEISEENTRHRYINLGHFVIFDDSYNASLESVAADLELMSLHKDKTKSVILTDILEVGEYASMIHEKIGKLIYEYGFDKLYAFGEYSSYTARGAMSAGMENEKIFILSDDTDVERCSDIISENVSCGEIILAKGSHRTNIGKILNSLEKRYKKNDA